MVSFRGANFWMSRGHPRGVRTAWAGSSCLHRARAPWALDVVGFILAGFPGTNVKKNHSPTKGTQIGSTCAIGSLIQAIAGHGEEPMRGKNPCRFLPCAGSTFDPLPEFMNSILFLRRPL